MKPDMSGSDLSLLNVPSSGFPRKSSFPAKPIQSTRVEAIATQINTLTTQCIALQQPRPTAQDRTSNPAKAAINAAINSEIPSDRPAIQTTSAMQTKYIVPTLDGSLLQITPQGAITPLVDLAKANLGIPFGLTTQGDTVIATTSGFLGDHYLVRVDATGQPHKIADLSAASGDYGGPFGVVVGDGKNTRNDTADYFVTLSPDATAATGSLLRVTPQGQISTLADLSEFGIPFAIIRDREDFVIAQQKGWLTRVSPQGQVSAIVNLVQAGLGIPFGVARWHDHLVATTNAGLVVRVGLDGQGAAAIANLLDRKYGLPAGIVVHDQNLIVSTNGGYLLRLYPEA